MTISTTTADSREAPSRARVVIDASALIALVLEPGQRGHAVGEALMDGELHAPELLPFEVSNVLRRHRVSQRLTSTEAALAHAGAAKLPITLWPFAAVSARVTELGSVLTSYDASYVALAERLQARLVTCDHRIARAPGIRCDIAAL